MTAPAHHLTDEWLLDYASGAASEPVALMVATHLSFCPTCRANAAKLEAIGGRMLETAPPVAVSADAWSRIAARLDEPAPVPAPAPPVPPGVPLPLASYLPHGLDGAAWSRIGFGVSLAALPCIEHRGFKSGLLRIGAGRAFAHHAHRGEEMLLVLRGSFDDQTGHYGIGDVAVYDEDVAHRPVAGPDGECICLALTSAPIRMTGFFTRLLNPFIRS